MAADIIAVTIMINHTQNKNLITLILGMLATVTPFAIDLYLPSFSQIATSLHSTTAKVSLSVSSYFIGMALGQLMYGPLLDRYGRKKPLFAGLILFMLASVICTFAKTVELLVVLRFMQAIGGSVAGVAAIAMVKDFFPPEQGARIFAMLILTIGVSPLLAPTIGGFVSTTFGWKAVFYLLTFIGFFAMSIVFLFLPEGQEPDKTVSLRLNPMLKTYFSVLTEPQFFTYTMAGSFSFATLFIYVAGSPIVFMEIYKVSPKMYGAIFAGLSVGFIGASQLNIFLTKIFSSHDIFRFALFMQVIAGVIFLVLAWNDWMDLYSTIFMFFILLSSVGLINPNGTALALAPFTKNVGSASAMLGFAQIGIAALASIGVGLFDSSNIFAMICLMVGTAAFALLLLIVREKKVVEVSENKGTIIH